MGLIVTEVLMFILLFHPQFRNIPAYTELTWDYSYEIGSVPGKIMYCKCGAKDCKGRLL